MSYYEEEKKMTPKEKVIGALSLVFGASGCYCVIRIFYAILPQSISWIFTIIVPGAFGMLIYYFDKEYKKKYERPLRNARAHIRELEDAIESAVLRDSVSTLHPVCDPGFIQYVQNAQAAADRECDHAAYVEHLAQSTPPPVD